EKKEDIPDFLNVYRQSVDIMEMQISRLGLRLNPPDILITPDLGHIKLMDFDLGKEIIKEGYEKTLARIDDIRRVVNGE
ncbi:MAG TPA: patatin, partial [Candidatus Marinimicrobia bacterium]|nr:patatin [Candidatus Neomarinimicrobiota bacterium]